MLAGDSAGLKGEAGMTLADQGNYGVEMDLSPVN